MLNAPSMSQRCRQLSKLRARTDAAQANAARFAAALEDLPGLRMQRIPEDRQSVHHKVRVFFDAAEAGLDLAQRKLRDALKAALTAEGVGCVLWQDHALPEHPLFTRFEGFGGGWPFQLAEDPDALRASYDPANFPRTRALLDGSVVLFSQTRPLIAQTAETVDRYAEALRKVWAERAQLVEIAAEL